MAYPPDLFTANHSAPLYHVGILFIVLLTVFTAVFFISRMVTKTMSGMEMYFMPLAYISCAALAVLAILMVKIGGSGRYVVAVYFTNPKTLETWLKLSLASQFAYTLGVTFPKLVILCLYLRIFGGNQLYRRITFFCGGVVIVNCLIWIISSFAICRPFAFNWDKTIPGGKCGDLMLAFKLASFPNIFTDLIMLALPMPIIWKLHTSTAQKVGLTITFLAGSFGTMTAFLRLYYFFTTDLFTDPTYNSVTLESWTVVEPGVYLIAAALPSLRPLFGLVMKTQGFMTLRSRLSMFSKSVFTRTSQVTSTDADTKMKSLADKDSKHGFVQIVPSHENASSYSEQEHDVQYVNYHAKTNGSYREARQDV